MKSCSKRAEPRHFVNVDRLADAFDLGWTKTAKEEVALTQFPDALLPPGFAGKPSAHEITLLDLATHHSGLPRDADNLNKNPANPYADYDARHLSDFLTGHGLAKPPQAKFLYSNPGFGLLGYALSQRAGVSYEQLVQTDITGPLRMHDTVVTMSPAQRKRLIQGYYASFESRRSLGLGRVGRCGRSKIHCFRYAYLSRCESAPGEIRGWC